MTTSNLFANLTPPVKEEEEVIENVTEENEAPVEEQEEESDEEVINKLTELDMLKQRATLMNISYSNNIGVEALKAKIQEKLDGPKPEDKPAQEPVQTNEATPATVSAPKRQTLHKMLREENLKLVRVRVTNFDEKDKALSGAIFTVANDYIGNVSKFVQYETEWHIPYCIYKMMRDMKFLRIRTVKKGNQDVLEQDMVRKFAIEILPPLTDKELATLAASQLGSGAIDKKD